MSLASVITFCRLWPRQACPNSLFTTAVCPSHVAITVERDLTSGKLQGYEEVKLQHCNTGFRAFHYELIDGGGLYYEHVVNCVLAHK